MEQINWMFFYCRKERLNVKRVQVRVDFKQTFITSTCHNWDGKISEPFIRIGLSWSGSCYVSIWLWKTNLIRFLCQWQSIFLLIKTQHKLQKKWNIDYLWRWLTYRYATPPIVSILCFRWYEDEVWTQS